MPNTGKVFVFYDSGDGLALKEAKDLKTDIVIGDHSLMTNYTFDSSIDSQTYNSVKIARPNKETGKADVFIMKDSETIGKWGLLQLYQKVDETANDAQCQEQARVSLEYYDRVLQRLKFSALGVPSLRAGALLLVNLSDLDGETVANKLEEMIAVLRTLGCEVPSPNITLSFITLIFIPCFGITDQGLFDVREFKIIDPVIELK